MSVDPSKCTTVDIGVNLNGRIILCVPFPHIQAKTTFRFYPIETHEAYFSLYKFSRPLCC